MSQQSNQLLPGNITKALTTLALPIMGTSFLHMAYHLVDWHEIDAGAGRCLVDHHRKFLDKGRLDAAHDRVSPTIPAQKFIH